MFKTDAEIDCYHDLILSEYSNLEANAFGFESKESRLDSDQVSATCAKYGVGSQELRDEGLLVPYPDGTFRTMHLDLVYRSINSKAAIWSAKIPLEFKLIRPKEESLPSFAEHDLEELEPFLNLDKKSSGILVGALRDSGYSGLAHHQMHYLKNIISRNDKCYLLVSPTASGKSLIFYVATLASILSEPETHGTKAIVLYPRKALASDQLMKFLRVIHQLNQRLTKENMPRITVGIDDGDTPRSSSSDEVKRQEVFRGLKCIQKGCNGTLRYQVARGSAVISCESCHRSYDEIVATKGDIWGTQPTIIFSNLSALNRRLMTKSAQSMIGSSVRWIVLDEAHVYREELGGHARWLLRRILARFSLLVKGDARFVVSSATIHNPLHFTKRLLGLSTGIYHEEYQKILEASKKKKRKLVINLIVAPNPLRSAESLAEEVSLLLGVWGFSNAKKTIVFIDNVSEVERLRDFVVRTIIRERQAQNDHINPQRNPSVKDPSEPFSWVGLTRGVQEIDSLKLSSIYDHHYAELGPRERARVEDDFKNRASGVLFATSTMELGMDIGSIAAIVQYKVPLTAESYVQRIGRAGRSDEVGRIALGILVVTNSPSQIRYVLGDEYKRLLEPQVEIPVAWENEEIKKQHVIFSILDHEASGQKNTYMDFVSEISGKWLSVADALNSLKTIVSNARKELAEVYLYEEEISGDKSSLAILDELLDKMEKKVTFGLANYNASSGLSVDEGLDKLRQSEDIILQAKRIIEQALQSAKELQQQTNVKELENFESSVRELGRSLSNVLGNVEKLWS